MGRLGKETAAGAEARQGGGWQEGNSNNAEGDSAVQNVLVVEPTGLPDGLYDRRKGKRKKAKTTPKFLVRATNRVDTHAIS